jgi:hypothetical protein
MADAATRGGAGRLRSSRRAGPARERGELDYLILECPAERTIALAQLSPPRDPTKVTTRGSWRGSNCQAAAVEGHGTRLVSNLGAANPLAAEVTVDIARRLPPVKVAAVTGDDVLGHSIRMPSRWRRTAVALRPLVSANAHRCRCKAAALATGAIS